MKIKDCIFGQIRDLKAEMTGISPLQINDELKSIIETKIITWDNSTGMNPKYNKYKTEKQLSYGRMLFGLHLRGLQFTEKLRRFETVEEYEIKIANNYFESGAQFSNLLGQWWHVHHFLQSADASEYDFHIFRQCDTYYVPWLDRDILEFTLIDNVPTVTGVDQKHIPVMYVLASSIPPDQQYNPVFVPSFAFALNNAAVKLCKDTFYSNVLSYIDTVYSERKDLCDYRIWGARGLILIAMASKFNMHLVKLANCVEQSTTPHNPNMPADCSSLFRV